MAVILEMTNEDIPTVSRLLKSFCIMQDRVLTLKFKNKTKTKTPKQTFQSLQITELSKNKNKNQ